MVIESGVPKQEAPIRDEQEVHGLHGIDSGPIVMVRRAQEEVHVTFHCRPAGGSRWLWEEDQGGRVLPFIRQAVCKGDGITGVVHDRRRGRCWLQLIGDLRGGGGSVVDTLWQSHTGSGRIHRSGHGVRGGLSVMVVGETWFLREGMRGRGTGRQQGQLGWIEKKRKEKRGEDGGIEN